MLINELNQRPRIIYKAGDTRRLIAAKRLTASYAMATSALLLLEQPIAASS
jgi:hypothetical protein